MDFLHREHRNALHCLCHLLKAPRYSAVYPHLHVNDSLTLAFDLYTRIKCIFGGEKSSPSKSANKKLNYYIQFIYHTTLVDLTIAHQHAMFRLTDTKNSLATPIHPPLTTPHSLATPRDPHSLATPINSHTLDPHWPQPGALKHQRHTCNYTFTGHTHQPSLAIPRVPHSRQEYMPFHIRASCTCRHLVRYVANFSNCLNH